MNYGYWSKKMTFIECLHKQIKERPRSIAVKSKEASLTYEELDKCSNLVREQCQLVKNVRKRKCSRKRKSDLSNRGALGI